MAQIQKKFIATNAVDETKIRLSNTGSLKARNAANSADVNILQVDATDKIVFASVPQVPGDASSPNDLVRYSQLVALSEGLKPKQAVVVASTANINLASGTDPGAIDGHTLVNGDRILLKDQTDPAENGIYVAVTAVTPSTWVRSADFNNVAEIQGAYTSVEFGTISQGYVYITTSAPAVLGTDPIVFVYRPNPAQLAGGDMIVVASGAIAVDLAAASGLESTNPGNAAGQLRVKLEAASPSLQIDGSNQLGVKLDPAGSIIKGASGVAVQLESSNPTLQIATNALGVKLNAAGAITSSASGLIVATDGVTTKIVSNAVVAQKNALEKKTLISGDITAQYVDLSFPISDTSSVGLFVVGGLLQNPGVDYSVSATGGVAGVGRITFLGDLASGGVSALVAGDILVVQYNHF
jgi:hypothetical protein